MNLIQLQHSIKILKNMGELLQYRCVRMMTLPLKNVLLS